MGVLRKRATVIAFVTMGFSLKDEPTDGSQDEMDAATPGLHNLRAVRTGITALVTGGLAQSRFSCSAAFQRGGDLQSRCALRWPCPARAAGNLLKAFERIGILANEEYQRGGLRIGFGAALLPFLEGSEVDA